MKKINRSLQAIVLIAVVFALISGCGPTRDVTPVMEAGVEAVPAADATSTPVPTARPSPTTPPGKVREPVVAGTWYSDDPAELESTIDGYLAAVEKVDGEPIALLVPHAGYTFSGQVAAYGFKQMEGAGYEVAVIIAADHQPPISAPISVWAEGGFQTPLGVVPVDVEVAGAIVEASTLIKADTAAHDGEHVIEIELPFLQRVCPGCAVVPILMGDAEEESIDALTDALVSALEGRKAVVIASSDLSHYPERTDAQKVDGATLAAIETGDPARVRARIKESMESGVQGLLTCACGEGPILVAMRVAEGLGSDTISVLRYANSADVPEGTPGRVVGYGAVMFWDYEPPAMTGEQREELLGLARSTLEGYLESGETPAYKPEDPELLRYSAAFVTLTKGGELRGCIGHIRADAPLYAVVQQMAIAAATSDPRFPTMTARELEDVKIEISVMSPFRRVVDFEEIEVGTHGLLLIMGGRQGLLLPQVPVEQGWSRDEYLDNLCLKSGLPTDCWHEDPTIYSFTAVVFGEE